MQKVFTVAELSVIEVSTEHVVKKIPYQNSKNEQLRMFGHLVPFEVFIRVFLVHHNHYVNHNHYVKPKADVIVWQEW